MKLLTKNLLAKLAKATRDNYTPVCKLDSKSGDVWLPTSIDANGCLWGFFEIGPVAPQFGYIGPVADLDNVVARKNITRDRNFKADPGACYFNRLTLQNL